MTTKKRKQSSLWYCVLVWECLSLHQTLLPSWAGLPVWLLPWETYFPHFLWHKSHQHSVLLFSPNSPSWDKWLHYYSGTMLGRWGEPQGVGKGIAALFRILVHSPSIQAVPLRRMQRGSDNSHSPCLHWGEHSQLTKKECLQWCFKPLLYTALVCCWLNYYQSKGAKETKPEAETIKVSTAFLHNAAKVI